MREHKKCVLFEVFVCIFSTHVSSFDRFRKSIVCDGVKGLPLILTFWGKEGRILSLWKLFPFVLETGLTLVQAGLELTVYPRLTLNLKQSSYLSTWDTRAGFCCTFIVLYVAKILTYGENKINKNPNNKHLLKIVVFGLGGGGTHL